MCRGVDDVIHGGRRGENGHVSGFEMLDPVAELGPIQTGHYYGVDQLPWEGGGGGQSLSFAPVVHWNVLWSDCHSEDKTGSFIDGYTLCHKWNHGKSPLV